MFGPSFVVVQYLGFFLVFRNRLDWEERFFCFYFICLYGVLLLLVSCCSSMLRRGMVCSV